MVNGLKRGYFILKIITNSNIIIYQVKVLTGIWVVFTLMRANPLEDRSLNNSSSVISPNTLLKWKSCHQTIKMFNYFKENADCTRIGIFLLWIIYLHFIVLYNLFLSAWITEKAWVLIRRGLQPLPGIGLITAFVQYFSWFCFNEYHLQAFLINVYILH